MKYRFLCFLIINSILFQSAFSQTPGILDNFTDANYSSAPTWTSLVGGSACTFVAGAMNTPANVNAPLRLYTNFSIPCQEWSFTVKASGSSNNDDFRYYFILKDNPDPTSTAAVKSDGYFVQYSGFNGDFFLYRVDDGVETLLAQNLSLLGSTTLRSVRITLTTAGLMKLFVGGTEFASVTDQTYPSCQSQYQMIRVVEAGDADYYIVDDFAYVTWPCTNVLSGTIIGNDQIQCQSFDPTALQELVAPCYYDPTGQPLQYQWQTSKSATGVFTNIAGATSSSYDPGTTNQNDYYRRLSKVSCAATWGEPSNVVAVVGSFAVTSKPLDTTIYVQSQGDAIFSMEVNYVSGNTFQWQVSTDGGGNWTNITSGVGGYTVSSPAGIGFRSFLQVDNPSLAMNGYKYQCVVTNSSPCNPSSIVTTPAATLFVKNQLAAAAAISFGCNQWDGQLDIPIVVSGVGTLNASTNLLRQINLTIGSSACKKDMRNYDFYLISPGGTVSLLFVDNFTSTSTPVWADIKFRDHPSLERLKDYSSTSVQPSYFPYSIGYFAVETDGSLASAFNGILADGTWTLRITETVSGVADGISISKAELIFGTDILERDVTGNSLNNSCALATCMGADQNVIIGTNNGYSENDPNYPGGDGLSNVPPPPPYPVASCSGDDGLCDWNGANNNSAWFYFIATSSTANLTVSGMVGGSNGSSDQQLMVLDGNNGCVTTGNWSIPNGGCLEDEFNCPSSPRLPNNWAYYKTNGGGKDPASIYVNGMTMNTEFKLSGLTPGRRYFLVIDGNAGTASSFYIEMESGCAFCSILNSILPVKFDSFNAYKKGTKNQLIWKTSEELNNDYFQVERSSDGINWTSIKDVEGAGRNSKSMRTYEVMDDTPLSGMNYYRIKTVTSDERFSYSEVRTILRPTNQPISVYPNPGKDIFTISGMEKGRMHQIRVLDINGKLIRSAVTGNDMYRLQMADAAPGMYLIQIDGKENLRFVKQR